MGWPTEVELKGRTDPIMKPGVETPTADWLPQTVADCGARSRTEVLSILAGRGYSPAQILAWVSSVGKPLMVDLFMYFFSAKACLDLRDADGQRVPPPAVLDPRTQLATMAITDADGLPITPDPPEQPKAVGFGKLKANSRFQNRDGSFKKW